MIAFCERISLGEIKPADFIIIKKRLKLLSLMKFSTPVLSVAKDFSAIAGYTLALLEMDEWINTRPFFYKIKTHYLVDQAIRLEYIIIQ